MRRIILCAALFCVCGVAARAIQQSSAKAAGPRVDGFYYAKVGGTTADPTYQYFRFYPDSSGATAYTSGKPAQVARWLSKNHQASEVGVYRLDGSTLKFVVGNERANTTYTGTLTPEAWTMNATGTVFAFAPVAFPAEQAGTNRPPKIAPVVSKKDNFAYNAVGNMTGVTTTIEITVTDPDNDPLTYQWYCSTGSVKGDGPKGVWTRPIEMGRPSPGIVTVVVNDGKGGNASRDFNFQ